MLVNIPFGYVMHKDALFLGTKLIGHMILKKELRDGNGSSANILGLKVIGGQELDGGRIGAVVEKVKKGSIADQVGRLRPGDEVIEWNGR